MVILVDDAVWPFRGERWAHLVSDSSYEELHTFVAALGIPRRAFQGDHYDLPERLRSTALAHGASAVSSRELVRRLRASGLRLARARPAAPVAHALGAARADCDAGDVGTAGTAPSQFD